MSKNLSHLTNINEAAAALRKSLLPYKWFIDTSVYQPVISRDIVVDKKDTREIIVYVTDQSHVIGPSLYHSWPVRYAVGVKR